MKRISVLFFLSLCFPLVGSAQKTWSLEECIKYAWENNLTIKQQELSVQQTVNNLFQSKMAMAPSVSARVSENINWGQSVDLSTLTILNHVRSSNTSMGLSADVDLFSGLKKWNTIKKNKASLSLSVQEVQKLRNDISIEITRDYLNVLLASELVQTTQKSLESVQQQCDRTRLLVDAGSQPLSSLLEIESQLATEQLQLVDAQNNLRSYYLTLKQLLDLPMENDFSVVIPKIDNLDELEPLSVEDMYYVSQNLPQIKKTEFTYSQRQHELDIARGDRYPRLSLNVGYSTFYSDSGQKKQSNTEEGSEEGGTGSNPLSGLGSGPFWDQLKNNNNPTVGLALSVPIFSQWQVNTNVKNARIGLEMADLEMRNAKQVLLKDIQQAANDATSTYLRCQATERNVASMEESFRYVQQKFDIGMLNGTDYTVSKTNLFKAQSDHIQAKYEHMFKLKILDFYKGIPITL